MSVLGRKPTLEANGDESELPRARCLETSLKKRLHQSAAPKCAGVLLTLTHLPNAGTIHY
jgi:hypothetical protein